MKLSLYFDHRFSLAPSGKIYSSYSFDYTLIRERYLSVFDHVEVHARVESRAHDSAAYAATEGPGVSVIPVGNWHGAAGILLHGLHARNRVHRSLLENRGAVISIAPGAIGQWATQRSKRMNRPYGTEVIGDPYEVFAPGVVGHPVRPLLRWQLTRQMEAQCASAAAVAYETSSQLQRRYPPAPDTFSIGVSSVNLAPDSFSNHVWNGPRLAGGIRCVTVGSLAQMYKGIDVLLHAVMQVVRSGQTMELNVIGDGKFRSQLQDLAHELGLDDIVEFSGQVPAGAPVREQLDRADLFILPSRTEGLPRAMIEAMARGLPCIGSTVGGIPELLPPEDMVPPGDAAALAAKIREVIGDPARMTRMSARNLDKARDYRADLLRERRNEFYRRVKASTMAWLVETNP